MAVGDLEGKIGEVNGQLRVLAPVLDELGKKVSGMGEKLAAQQENLKSVWHEIREIKKRAAGGSSRWWQVGLSLISAILAAVVTLVIAKLVKGTL